MDSAPAHRGTGRARHAKQPVLPPRGAAALSRYARHAERALSGPKVSFRDLDLKHFDAEVELCWDIYNSAWEKNWGFVPMTHAEFVHEAKVLKYAVLPEFSFAAEVDGAAAGFM